MKKTGKSLFALLLLAVTLLTACKPAAPGPGNETGGNTSAETAAETTGNGKEEETVTNTDITKRKYEIVNGIAVQPGATAPAGLSEAVNEYMVNYEALKVEGAVTTFQTGDKYRPGQRINTEAVMAYLSVPSSIDTVLKSWLEAKDYYSINVMMPINRDSNDYVQRNKANYGDIQTDAQGKYITHSTSDKVYYMVPTENWTEYIWEIVSAAVTKYDLDSITFEEPEMWYASGYSEGFKREWEAYYGEDWQPQNASPEAMLKTMRLKVYLFDRVLSEIADRIHKASPKTKVYVASHSTASYTAIQITAGLNTYLASGKIDGVIGQTWTNTSLVSLKENGKSVQKPFESSYLGYASFAGASGKLDLFAITDTMADGSTPDDEDYFFPVYQDNLVAALMQPEIHRFEASVWPGRGFEAVTSGYRTVQLSIFAALNEMAGKKITYSAGTPGIAYLLSDSLSWQFGSSWSLSSKDGYYGVTLPLIADGIPLKVLSMENVKSADDLKDVTLLIASWDIQKPTAEATCDAICEWVKNGGTLLYLGGHDKYEVTGYDWWKDSGSPLQGLIDKLGLDLTVTTLKVGSGKTAKWVGDKNYASAGGFALAQSEGWLVGFEGASTPILTMDDNVIGTVEEAGKGHVVLCGVPSAYFPELKNGSEIVRTLTEFAADSFTDLGYSPASLMWTKRGNLVAAHSIGKKNALVGSFIDLLDPSLPVIPGKEIKANGSALLYDISSIDLSVPRVGFAGGTTESKTETAEKTVLTLSGPDGSNIAMTFLCADGTYPASVLAEPVGGIPFEPDYIWKTDTDSLQITVPGGVKGVTVTVTWGKTKVDDTEKANYAEFSVLTNNKNEDKDFLTVNQGGSNDSLRFADAGGKLVYRFDLTVFHEATVTMRICQNYIVEWSTDNKKWNTIADYSKTEGYNGTLKGGGNDILLSFYPSIYGKDASELYVRITDCNPSDGWGGSISSINVRYKLYEGETAYGGGRPAFEPTDADASDYAGMKQKKITVNSAHLNDDREFAVTDTSNANGDCKFCDLNKELVYRFDLNEYENAVVLLEVCQNYLIEVSSDGKKWAVIQNFEEEHGYRFEGNGNKAKIAVSAEKYAKGKDALYIRIANSDTSKGWGGALTAFTVFYE